MRTMSGQDNSVAAFEATVVRIKKCLRMNEGSVGAENNFKDAYQKLVHLGIKPQIRAKYRGSAQAKKVAKGRK